LTLFDRHNKSEQNKHKKKVRYHENSVHDKGNLNDFEKNNNYNPKPMSELPAIIQSSSKDIELYAKTPRYKSFDRSTNRSKLNHSVINNVKEPVDPFKYNSNFQNKSMDGIDEIVSPNLRHSSLDPISSLAKLRGIPKKHNLAEYISCPISPHPNNNEHWPGTMKKSNGVLSNFSSSPKNLMEKYEKERKSKVLSVHKLVAKHKPLSVWDAMSIYDLEQFKKENLINEINRREKQRQLKFFYDKQVQDKKEKVNYEKQKASHDHLDILSE
jgi:hypothetical protein